VVKGNRGKGKRRASKDEGGRRGGCWKSWTSLRPERPGTTPEGSREHTKTKGKGSESREPRKEESKALTVLDQSTARKARYQTIKTEDEKGNYNAQIR